MGLSVWFYWWVISTGEGYSSIRDCDRQPVSVEVAVDRFEPSARYRSEVEPPRLADMPQLIFDECRFELRIASLHIVLPVEEFLIGGWELQRDSDEFLVAKKVAHIISAGLEAGDCCAFPSTVEMDSFVIHLR